MRTALAALFLGGLVAALLLQAGFLHLLLILAAAEYLLGPTLIALAVLGIAGLVRGKPPSPNYRRATFLMCATIAAMGLSYGTGCAIYYLRTNATHTAVDRIVSSLTETKERTGSYPTALPDGLLAASQSMLSFPLEYRSSGTDFSISYDDPCGMMSHFEFDGSNRYWHHHGD